MLDQNTTTVLTTLITVLGTLGGVILGVFLTNRYAARQEKAKRNTVVIEEIFINFYQMNVSVLNNFAKHELITKEIDNFNRASILTYLYLPTEVNSLYSKYIEAIYNFANELENIKNDEKADLTILERTHPEVFNNYFNSMVISPVRCKNWSHSHFKINYNHLIFGSANFSSSNSVLMRPCCKNLRGKRWTAKSRFLLSLSGYSKQAGDKRYLPQDVAFSHAAHLSFPHHVHHLISL